VIALLFRLTGKRGLASLSMFDFVVIFLLSNVVRNRDHRQRHLPSMLGTPSAVFDLDAFARRWPITPSCDRVSSDN
jgi:hypothetical protein